MASTRTITEALESISVENSVLVIRLTTGGARVGFHPGMDVPALAQQLRVLIHKLEDKLPQSHTSPPNVSRQANDIVK
jgi:hypothetical protein